MSKAAICVVVPVYKAMALSLIHISEPTRH